MSWLLGSEPELSMLPGNNCHVIFNASTPRNVDKMEKNRAKFHALSSTEQFWHFSTQRLLMLECSLFMCGFCLL